MLDQVDLKSDDVRHRSALVGNDNPPAIFSQWLRPQNLPFYIEQLSGVVVHGPGDLQTEFDRLVNQKADTAFGEFFHREPFVSDHQPDFLVHRNRNPVMLTLVLHKFFRGLILVGVRGHKAGWAKGLFFRRSSGNAQV